MATSRRKGLGKGKGKGYKDMLKTDPIVKGRSGRGITTYTQPLNRRIERLEKDVGTIREQAIVDQPIHKLSKNPHQAKMQRQILNMLYRRKFYKGEDLTEHEVMTIIVLNEPSEKLDGQIPADQLEFLSNYTNWTAVGETRKWGREKNLIIQLEFLDSKTDRLGRDLVKLFKEYNRMHVKEDTLYVRTQKVSESTLPLRKWRTPKRKGDISG